MHSLFEGNLLFIYILYYRDESYSMDECESFRNKYDKCFNTWFRDKYLKGIDDDSMCSDLLKNYTGCVKV